MKKIIFLLSFVLIIISCSKNEINDQESSLTYRSRTDIFSKLGVAQNDITVNNGILKFKDQNTLDTVRQKLEMLRNDTAFVAEYLSSLGLTDADEELQSIPWEPALAYFTSFFDGFYPLGEVEENREKQYNDIGTPDGFVTNKSKLREDIWWDDTYEVTVKPNYVSVDFYVTDLGAKFGPYNLHW